MNEIRREDPNAKVIQDISAVVERHGWPDSIEGFKVRLGEFEGDPAVWITYQMKAEALPLQEGWEDRADRLNALANAVSFALLDVDDKRQTFFRFADPPSRRTLP